MSVLCNNENDKPTVADVFRHHQEVSDVTVKLVAARLRVSETTAWRIFSGASEEKFRLVADCISKLPAPLARDIACYLVRDAGFTISETTTAPRDSNGDGRVDGEDALDSTIEALRTAQEVLEGVRAGLRGGRVSGSQLAQIIASANATKRHLDEVIANASTAAESPIPIHPGYRRRG